METLIKVQTVIFILSFFWVALLIAPNYPNLIEWMLLAYPIAVMGFFFYPLYESLFFYLKELIEKKVK